MAKYIITRLLLIIPIMLSVSIVVFIILSLSPGDPATLVLGPTATDADKQMFREQNGLDKPLVEQYISYIAGVLRGDLGRSYATRQSVIDMISIRIGPTLQLTLGADLVLSVFGILLGILLALKQNSLFDNIMRVVMVIFSGMPQFWLAMIGVLLFSVNLGWLPSSGFEGFTGKIMPIFCTAVGGLTVVSRTTRASMLEVITQDYIRTGKAKGLPEQYIVRHHAVKNALLPILTVLGRYFSACIAGAAVIEMTFNINGLGKCMIESLRMKDIPTVMACVLFSAFITAIVNVAIDIAYAFVDPRIKSKYTSGEKKKSRREDGHEAEVIEK